MKTLTILETLVVVQLDMNVFGGRKTLTPEDLRAAFGDKYVEVPKNAVTPGSIKLIDADALKVFNRLKQRARRACLAAGTSFMGGFAIPETGVTPLMVVLNEIGAEFTSEIDTIVARWDSAVTAWAKQFPEWESVIKANAPTADWVRSQFGYAVGAFRISPAAEAAAAVAAAPELDLIEGQVGSLGVQIVREIAQDVRASVDHGAGSRLAATARSVLSRVRNKAAGLAFIAPHINNVVLAIDTVYGHVPDNGKLEGFTRLAVDGLFAWLSDEKRIVSEVFSIDEQARSATAVTDDDQTEIVSDDVTAGMLIPAPLKQRRAFDPQVLAF